MDGHATRIAPAAPTKSSPLTGLASASAVVWLGRTTAKWRRSSVAISLTPRRSAAAITEASTLPSGRSW